MNRVLLTVKEASELTGIPAYTIYELCRQGKIPRAPQEVTGRQVRIPRAELLKVLGIAEPTSTKPQSPPEPPRLMVDITNVDPRELGEALLAVLRKSAISA